MPLYILLKTAIRGISLLPFHSLQRAVKPLIKIHESKACFGYFLFYKPSLSDI